MTHATCIRCGRQIVYAKRSDTHENMALEKIIPYTIDISAIGSTAYRVDPLDKSEHLDIYTPHIIVCHRKETT